MRTHLISVYTVALAKVTRSTSGAVIGTGSGDSFRFRDD